jgi:hypothetical protein
MIWRDERSILESRAAQISRKRQNYKEMHRGTAERKGVLREFLAAPTLTQMRRILFG